MKYAPRLRVLKRPASPAAPTGLASPADVAAPVVGVQAKIRSLTGSQLVATVTRMREAGVSLTREDFPWGMIEPTPGVYRWNNVDPWVAEAARQGLGIVAIPDAPPGWASASSSTAPTSVAALSAYTRFVRAILNRYGANGTFWAANPELPKSPIQYVDVWNEPYLAGSWGSTPDPAAYARMFRTVVTGARSADPKARFLLEADTGAFGTYPYAAFLAPMFAAVPELASLAYAVSIHPYASNGWSPAHCSSGDWRTRRYETCRITDVRTMLDAAGASNLKIWITEIGWSTAPNAAGAVTEQTQADYVHQLFSLLRNQWKGTVDAVIWYSYSTPEQDPANAGDYFGLVHADGTPKPAWLALRDEIAAGSPG